MSVDILHISDIHFSDGGVFKLRELLEVISKVVDEYNISAVFISGDIGNRGSEENILHSKCFLGGLKNKGIEDKGIFLVPGNHDIVEKSFKVFDEVSYFARKDGECLFSNKSVNFISFNNLDILLVNSSYHLNHEYGLVDLEEVRGVLEAVDFDSRQNARVCMLHHHLLPVLEKDTSAVRNSYDFMNILDEYKFSNVLHGHMHMKGGYSFGENKVKVSSGRSANSAFEGFINGFSIVKLSDEGSVLIEFAIERTSDKLEARKISER